MNTIVWLASYPKSGNTWFRAFLQVLIKNQILDINKLNTGGIFSSKSKFEEILDINADSLKQSEILHYRTKVYEYLSNQSNETQYIKIHDAFTLSSYDNYPIVPINASKKAIYIVRNPLDVSLSLANHLNLTIEEVIKLFINNKNATFNSKKNSNSQFQQYVGTWAIHVESWLNQEAIPLHIIKFEDMKSHPHETFKNAITAIGLEANEDKINQAIEETKFEKLRAKELKHGFIENQNINSTFFFKGEVGRWKDELTQNQIDQIIDVNGETMGKMGYL